MKTTTETQKSNNLKYNITTKDSEGNTLDISIRLNDKCKNGHQDFAITGIGYEKGKPKTDRYNIYGGCCHEEILKAKPKFKIFVDLHLCDYAGVPMHPSANGHYHMEEGFNKTKPTSPEFKAEYCEYYRITESQFDVLKTAENQIQFALYLESLGILKQWDKQAKKAIKLLEKLTGSEFVNDSKRSQYVSPTAEERAEEKARIESGYYTESAKQEREHQAQQKELNELKEELNKEIHKHKTEYEVKKEVLLKGGSKALKNCIFYNHTQTLSFNWKSYDNLSDEELKFVDSLVLPSGVTVTIK